WHRRRDGRTSQRRGFDYERCSDARQMFLAINGWARRTTRGRHARREILEDASFAPALAAVWSPQRSSSAGARQDTEKLPSSPVRRRPLQRSIISSLLQQKKLAD